MHEVGEETDDLADDEHGGAPENQEMHPSGIGFVHHPGVADDHTERGLDPAEHVVGSRFFGATLPEEPVAEEGIAKSAMRAALKIRKPMMTGAKMFCM